MSEIPNPWETNRNITILKFMQSFNPETEKTKTEKAPQSNRVVNELKTPDIYGRSVHDDKELVKSSNLLDEAFCREILKCKNKYGPVRKNPRSSRSSGTKPY